MSFYGFKPNPRQRVVNKAKTMYGVMPYDVKAVGCRPDVARSKELNIPHGMYYVECLVKNQKVASAFHKDWRKAYNLLLEELEKLAAQAAQ